MIARTLDAAGPLVVTAAAVVATALLAWWAW